MSNNWGQPTDTVNSLNGIFRELFEPETPISAFGVQGLFIRHGSDLDINSLEGAMNIIMGNGSYTIYNHLPEPEEPFYI